MKQDLLKAIQKFLNGQFRYDELIAFLDLKKDFLLDGYILSKTSECEYNAIWDLITYLEKFFSFAQNDNLIITTKTSLNPIYEVFYEARLKIDKVKGIILLQKVDCNCNDCKHMKRDLNKKPKKNTPCPINYGHCTKFDKPVSFIPAVCQLDTQHCFEHRKS